MGQSGRAIIRHHRFVIWRFVHGDETALVQHFGQPEILKAVRGRSWKYGRAAARKYLGEKNRQYRRRRPVYRDGETETLGYAVEINGHLAGGIGVTLDGHKAEIGYWLAQPHWGRGLMTAIVRAWVAYLFKKYHVRRVAAKVFPFNRASARILQKNGFRFAGRLIRSRRAGRKPLDDLLFTKTR